MENFETKEVMDAAQKIGEEASTYVKSGAGRGIGKYVGAAGIAAGVVAGIFGIVKIVKAKSTKNDLVIADTAENDQVSETEDAE